MALDSNLEVWCDRLYQSAPAQTLDKLRVQTHWVRTMKTLLPVPELDSVLGLPTSSSFLFCGPGGTGKQTLALATAGSLVAAGYQFLRFTGSDFDSQLRAKFKTLFQRISPEQPMVIVAEDLSSCAEAQNLGTCLGQMAYACRIQKLPMILIVIHEDEDELPQELRRHLYTCRFTMPDRDERMAFFEALVGKRFPLREGLTARDLANASDGLNLWQLYQSLRFMQMRVKEKALASYKTHYELAVSAIRAKEVTVDMEDYREIVKYLKTPKKESAAPVQIVQAAPAMPTSLVSTPAAPDHKKTHAEELVEVSDMSGFMAKLLGDDV